MRVWLLDTGPLVAYLDANEPEHSRVASFLDGFAGQLSTTGAVITEAMHFVSEDPEGPGVLAAFAETSGMLVLDFAQPAHLTKAAALMKKYADTPMDFADATLVLLAEELEARDICHAGPARFHNLPDPWWKVFSAGVGFTHAVRFALTCGLIFLFPLEVFPY